MFDRIRASVRGVITCPASGDAVTVVPATAIGGGRGLFGRNRGWMYCSEGARSGLLWDRDVGREKLGGVDGGDELIGRGGLDDQSDLAKEADDMACGDSGKKGPSRASAGESGRLPGMVASPGRAMGDEV